MLEIYECTDCGYCASFGWGFRVACTHPNFPADEVYKYSPVAAYKTAESCIGFVEDSPVRFPESDIDKAVKMFGDDVTSLRKWYEANK